MALQAAKANARNAASSPARQAPPGRIGRTVRGDGREPRGLAAVFQQLVTERAWEVPAAGGSVLQQWPAIAPDLAPHVQAVGFDADHGRLDLLPDSPAYATQLRMSTAAWSRWPTGPPAATRSAASASCRPAPTPPPRPPTCPGCRAGPGRARAHSRGRLGRLPPGARRRTRPPRREQADRLPPAVQRRDRRQAQLCGTAASRRMPLPTPAN